MNVSGRRERDDSCSERCHWATENGCPTASNPQDCIVNGRLGGRKWSGRGPQTQLRSPLPEAPDNDNKDYWVRPASAPSICGEVSQRRRTSEQDGPERETGAIASIGRVLIATRSGGRGEGGGDRGGGHTWTMRKRRTCWRLRGKD